MLQRRRKTPRAVGMAGTLKNSMSGEAGESATTDFVEDTSYQRPEQRKSTAVLWENKDPYVPYCRPRSASACCPSYAALTSSAPLVFGDHAPDSQDRRDRAGLRYGPKAAAHLTVRRFQEALVNKEVKVGSLWEERAVSAPPSHLRTVSPRLAARLHF